MKFKLLLIATLCFMLDMSISAQTTVIPSGSGTSDDPFLISSLQNLYWLSVTDSLWSQGLYFRQTADIDAAKSRYINNGTGFSPIGKVGSFAFTGHYNGAGHLIENLYINRSDQSGVGLFGYASDAYIDSLGIVDCEIIGSSSVGAVAGTVKSVTVSNSFITGSLKVENSVVDIPQESNAVCNVSNCYIVCSVEGDAFNVGIAGASCIINAINVYGVCSFDGEISAIPSFLSKSTFINCYHHIEVGGQSYTYGNLVSEEELQSLSTYTNWDFAGLTSDGTEDIWAISSSLNEGYPVLTWQIDEFSAPELGSVSGSYNEEGTSLTLTGSFIDLGMPNPVNYGFCYSSDKEAPDILTCDTTCLGAVNGYGKSEAFSVELTGFDTNKSLNICAYAINATDTVYSSVCQLGSYEDEVKGTEENPYLISSLDDLRWLSETDSIWSKGYYFKQTDNIDASDTKDWNDGLGFSPIGKSGNGFIGNYDGSGYTIDGLYINRPDESNIGLFGYVSDCQISSIGITDCFILGNSRIGSLIGYGCSLDNTANISNCYSIGEVEGLGSNIGGLIGYVEEVNASYCYSVCAVYGTSNVGGLIGYNGRDDGDFIDPNWDYSIINNSYSAGVVKGTGNYIGGLVGYNYGSQVKNCYATSSVTGQKYIGGLVGANYYGYCWVYWDSWYAVSGSIVNCYSTGIVLGVAHVGGLAGDNNSGISNSYYNSDITKQVDTDLGTPITSLQMKKSATFDSFDFTSDWEMTEGLNFPHLKGLKDCPAIMQDIDLVTFVNSEYSDTIHVMQMDAEVSGVSLIKCPEGMSLEKDSILKWIPEKAGNDTIEIQAEDINGLVDFYSFVVNVYTFLGSGTEDDPFRITNLEDLKVLSENAELWGHSYYFRQTKNIDASETKDWNDGLGFSPIGNSTERFYGNYNGGGNTIDSLYINRSDEDNVGLFGVVEDTKIRSLTITNSVIKGKGNVGVLVGAVYSSDINYSYTAGSVTGSTNVGGMVGYNFRSNLKHSYSTGSVGGTSCVGGLVGYNMFDKYYENITKFVKSRIDYCYSTGRVKGIKNIGGIVGYNSSSIVTNSYSTGSVTGSLSVGGLVGSNTKYYQENLWEQYAYWIDPYYVESEIDNCYSVSLVSGNSDVGGVVGYNESDISGCYYNETVSTSNDDENGNPVTTAQLQSLSTFSGWDFAGLSSDGTDDIWAISSYLNEGYPVLTWEIDDFSVPELLSTAVTLNDNGTSATLTSGFSYLGMANPVAYGFCYATDEEVPDILASEIIDLGAVNGYEEAGEFSGEMQNVDENSTYYIRAYAINAADTVYSSNVLMISDNNVYEMGVDLEVFTSIEDEGEQAIVIYPNPVSSILYVDNAGGIAVIYNLAGQQVIYHDLDESNAIDLSELKGGLYLLQVDKKTFKVVKK